MGRPIFVATGSLVLGMISAKHGGSGYLRTRLNRTGQLPAEWNTPKHSERSTLFYWFPGLARKIPWISLGERPTPVEELGRGLGLPEGLLWVKRDDLTALTYGGNKVRKQEHLLADARLRGRKSIITMGGLGSNHAMATAAHATIFGFEVHLCLMDQPVNEYVRRNLAGFQATGARIHYCKTLKVAYRHAARLFRQLEKEGKTPYFFGPGGTNGLSNIGHVNAALELAQQIKEGALPLPDTLFIAAGTCGTISGLVAGLKIAGLATKVKGVQVVNPSPAYSYLIRFHAQRVADLLHRLDGSVPKVRIKKKDYEILTGYLGGGYGTITPEGKLAVERVAGQISLETTYTGKTLAACLDYCSRVTAREKVLFWNSYNSADFKQSPTYDGLPSEILKKLSF